MKNRNLPSFIFGVIWLCTMIISIQSLYGQHAHHQNKISGNPDSLTEVQKRFINQVVEKYISAKNWFKKPELALEKVDYGNNLVFYKCRLKDSLILSVPSGEKVLLFPHSSHQSEEIGDITVAICQNGKVYLHFGHICGGIISFISKPGIKVYSANDFFLQTLDDVEDEPWWPMPIQLNKP